MIELILLLFLAWALRGWLETPTDEDVGDYIVVSEFDLLDE